jgi:methionine synthase II (cobalamin-independent)
MIVTAVGSLPEGLGGFAEATRVVVGEMPDLPHVVELPALGPGADMVGRTGALLPTVTADLSWETTTDGWRHCHAPGRAMRRAVSWWGESLDAIEEALADREGPVKTQACGPWTFASSVETFGGDRALRDAGFVRDISGALAEALVQHVLELRRRTGAEVVVQLDEPALPAVLAGRVPTSSGLGRISAVEESVARTILSSIVDRLHAVDARVAVHCCAADAPISLLRDVGVDAVSIDLAVHSPRNDEPLGECIDRGIVPWLGVIPAVGAPDIRTDTATATGDAVVMVEAIRRRLGFGEQEWAQAIGITPSCGLAGSTPAWARAALAATREIGKRLAGDSTLSDREAEAHGR